MVVGGGTGIGPLIPLTEKLVKKVDKITVMSGAKSRDNLLFLDRIPEILSQVNSKFLFTTEDGSYGFECLVTKQVEKRLAKETGLLLRAMFFYTLHISFITGCFKGKFLII